MTVLTKEQIIALHEEFINETGGSHGIKDKGLLESALASPFQTLMNRNYIPLFIKKPQDLVLH